MSRPLFQIYRDGKPFAGASSSREFLEEGVKRLRTAYPGSLFEVREAPHSTLKARELVPGKLYRWTAAESRPCRLLTVRTPEEEESAVEMLDNGTVYIGASTQLFEYEGESYESRIH